MEGRNQLSQMLPEYVCCLPNATAAINAEVDGKREFFFYFKCTKRTG